MSQMDTMRQLFGMSFQAPRYYGVNPEYSYGKDMSNLASSYGAYYTNPLAQGQYGYHGSAYGSAPVWQPPSHTQYGQEIPGHWAIAPARSTGMSYQGGAP